MSGVMDNILQRVYIPLLLLLAHLRFKNTYNIINVVKQRTLLKLNKLIHLGYCKTNF